MQKFLPGPRKEISGFGAYLGLGAWSFVQGAWPPKASPWRRDWRDAMIKICLL